MLNPPLQITKQPTKPFDGHKFNICKGCGQEF